MTFEDIRNTMWPSAPEKLAANTCVQCGEPFRPRNEREKKEFARSVLCGPCAEYIYTGVKPVRWFFAGLLDEKNEVAQIMLLDLEPDEIEQTKAYIAQRQLKQHPLLFGCAGRLRAIIGVDEMENIMRKYPKGLAVAEVDITRVTGCPALKFLTPSELAKWGTLGFFNT